MPKIISPDEKISVIEDWLDGETREDIVMNNKIGSGTVYNIVQEWRNRIGIEKADTLRELAVKLKKNGLTVSDCAKGFRMVMVFKKYGIEEDEEQDGITYFLKEIYLKCQEVNLTPQKVFMYIYDIINFSKEVLISQIPQFLKKKNEEKRELETSIQNLYQKINELEETQHEKEQEMQNILEMVEKMSKYYTLFIIVKQKLDKYGISMENFNQFADCVKGIAKENYDVSKVLEKIRYYDNLVYYIQLCKKEVETKKDELNKLNQEMKYGKGLLDSYRIKLEVIDELERMGFGINELRIIYNTLMEIGRENNIENKTFEQIKKEFFNDLKNYDEILGSRNERVRLQAEIKHLEMQLIKEKERYNSYPKVIESIERLSNAGISENDIIKMENIISMTDTHLYKNKPSKYKQNLIDELQKYGNLKLAIKNLEDKRRKINLKFRKKTLQPQRQKQKR